MFQNKGYFIFFSISGNLYFPEKTKAFFPSPDCPHVQQWLFVLPLKIITMPLFQMQCCRPKNILQKNSLGDRYSHEKIVIPLLISTSVWNFQFHCTVHFENIITMHLTSTCTSNSDISLSQVMLNTSSVQSNKFQGCALRTIKGSLML